MNEEKNIIIYVDYREEKSGIPQLLESAGLKIVRTNLSVGDYVLSNEIVIERKNAYDFVHSLFDGRLFDQARRLRETYGSAIIIVEGNPIRIRRYKSRSRQIYAAIATLTLDFDIKILYSEGIEHTAIIIESLARRLMRTQREAVVLHKKPKLETLRDQQLYVIQSFPSIGVKTAKKILEKFGSIKDFCNATISELSSVEGIGEKKAEQIYKLLNLKYKNAEKKQIEAKKRKATLMDFYESDDK